ncbi:MAG: hypothetical protein WDM89_01380 [Rhizomicrobium sp.]
MSDIFHEVEEDVRRERFEKLWKQYGDYAVAALAVVILAIAGLQVLAALRPAATGECLQRASGCAASVGLRR